jgi:hypothetical protein
MTVEAGTPLATRFWISAKSRARAEDIFAVVEEFTPREVAAESTAGLTFVALEQPMVAMARHEEKRKSKKCLRMVVIS